MSTKITPKVKNKVWQDYTKNSNSKNELKQMFLGMNPTNAYKKISLKLKKKLDQVKVSSPVRKTLRPKIPNIKSSKKSSTSLSSRYSPSRKTTKSKRISSPKRSNLKISSPKRSSPKRSSSKRKTTSRTSPKRHSSSSSRLKLVRSPGRKSNKDKLSSVRLIKN